MFLMHYILVYIVHCIQALFSYCNTIIDGEINVNDVLLFVCINRTE